MAEATTKATKKATKTTPLLKREPKVLAEESGYVAAALVDETLEFVKELPGKVKELREQAPTKVGELREQAPESVKKGRETITTKVDELRTQIETSVKDLRDRATKTLEGNVAKFEKGFDARVKAGKKVADELRKDERVAKVEGQLNRVWEQTGNSRSQIKAAVTSVRKTADVSIEAGKKQAKVAESKVKAASTSVKKTVDTAVDAGKAIVSDDAEQAS